MSVKPTGSAPANIDPPQQPPKIAGCGKGTPPQQGAQSLMADTVRTITAGKGSVPVSLDATPASAEEPDRRKGVTFRNMLKSAEDAAAAGISDSAAALYGRALGLADDAGDLLKLAKSAECNNCHEIAQKACEKGAQCGADVSGLTKLARFAAGSGFAKEARALLDKAISGCDNARVLRRLAEDAGEMKLPDMAKKAFDKIASLPGKG